MEDNYSMSQCVLKKGNITKTAWIASSFAKVGKLIDLKEADGWEDGWQVEKVYTASRYLEVRERSQDHKKQRQASDI